MRCSPAPTARRRKPMAPAVVISIMESLETPALRVFRAVTWALIFASVIAFWVAAAVWGFSLVR